MKKLAIILAFFLFIPSILAISTDLKETYQPGETLIAEISGNILEPITRDNIELKRANVQVPWEYDVKRIGDRYFIWGIAPSSENNYTLHVNNIATTVNGIVKIIGFNQSFSTSGEFISYSIKPGFAIFQTEFEFDIFLNKDFPEAIAIDFPEEREFILNPGENTLTLMSNGIESGFKVIKIGFYSVPILVEDEEEEIIDLPELRFFPRSIESVILSDEEIFYPFTIINNGEFELTNLELEFDPEIFLIEPGNLDFIGSNETAEFNLSLVKSNEPINEIITLRSGDLLLEFPISIDYTENVEEVNTPYLDEGYSEGQAYYCLELGGQSCSADQTCSGQTTSTLDVLSCCIGTCTEQEQTGFAWVGFLIGIVIVAILIIIVIRYKKSKKHKKDPLKEKLSELQKPSPPSSLKEP